MLPVARKPIVQYVVEELVRNGIQEILFVTGRSKSSIENHFDDDPELERTLTATKKTEFLKEIAFGDLGAHFLYTRQRVQRGLGDAILCGESFAAEDAFVVALGDSILGLNATSTVVTKMMEVFESKRASCVIAVEEVPREETRHYGIVKPETLDGDSFRIVAGDLRHDPADRSGQAGRDSDHRCDPAVVRRGQTRHGGQAATE
jgi:UTP--glucose-1-phosphate uridylyltransferase